MAKGAIGKRLRKHLREVLDDLAANGEGRQTDAALLAELRFKHPIDYGANLKEKVMIREIGKARAEIEHEGGKGSSCGTGDVAFRHVRPGGGGGGSGGGGGGGIDDSSDGEEDPNVVGNDGSRSAPRKRPLPSPGVLVSPETVAAASAAAAVAVVEREPKRSASGTVEGGASLNQSLRTTYAATTAGSSSSSASASSSASTSASSSSLATALSALASTRPATNAGAREGEEGAPRRPPSGSALLAGARKRLKRSSAEGGGGGAESGDDARGGRGEVKLTDAVAYLSERPSVRYRDLGGMEAVVPLVRQLVELPLRHPVMPYI